jgi:tRNA pseudouridine38-40 synthase
VRTIRLTVEYAGTRFHGWQRQPDLRTVQGELEAALATILREPVSLAGAGRTDAGVHALAQVASFETEAALPLERIARGVNALTGDDVRVREVIEAEHGFHARHSARARHYVYLLLAQPSSLWEERAYWPRRRPDRDAMNAAAEAFVGEHDFAAFSCHTADERGTGTLVHYARWEPWPRGIALRIGAVRFLHKMVRAIVAHSLRVGWGEIEPRATARLLAQPAGRATRVAAPRGLYLARVDYAAGPGGADCPPDFPVL